MTPAENPSAAERNFVFVLSAFKINNPPKPVDKPAKSANPKASKNCGTL